MMIFLKKLKDYHDHEIEAFQRLNLKEVNMVMNVLEEARLSQKRIFVCDNGGSAAIASHYCCDFNKGVSEHQDIKYSFECLSDNIPTMMVVANDLSYDEVFRFPL